MPLASASPYGLLLVGFCLGSVSVLLVQGVVRPVDFGRAGEASYSQTPSSSQAGSGSAGGSIEGVDALPPASEGTEHAGAESLSVRGDLPRSSEDSAAAREDFGMAAPAAVSVDDATVVFSSSRSVEEVRSLGKVLVDVDQLD